MERSCKPAEVISSTFDERPNATCSAESGHRNSQTHGRAQTDVVILLDSITRLARAYQHRSTHSGRFSPWCRANALHNPKRFFGAARNIEEGGSLEQLSPPR